MCVVLTMGVGPGVDGDAGTKGEPMCVDVFLWVLAGVCALLCDCECLCLSSECLSALRTQ